MQVVILAGGLGTRLGDLTAQIPKPMVSVRSRPFLEWQLKYLGAQGFTEFLFLTGYKSQVIKEYFGNGKKLSVKIDYSEEPEPLGTGGALALAKNKLASQFLLMFGDSFLPLNYKNMSQSFKSSEAEVMMALYDNSENTGVPYNVSYYDKRVVTYYKKNLSQGQVPGDLNYVDAGVYGVKKGSLASLEAKFCSFEADLLQPAINSGKVSGYVSESRFFDIGTPKLLEEFERRMGDYF